MELNPSASTGLQFHKARKGGFLGPDFRSKMGLPVINIPGCPAHPDWITQIIVAWPPAAARRRPRQLHRPATFFKTFTQTVCTRVQFFEYKRSTMSFGEGMHRLPVLRVRLPGSDDPLAVQPHPVEPAVLETGPGMPCLGCTRAGVTRISTWPRNAVQDPEGSAVIPRRFRRIRTTT